MVRGISRITQWYPSVMILFDESLKKSIQRMREQCLAKWLQSMLGSIAGEIIPIDGKSQRGSYDRNQGVKALHCASKTAILCPL
jgi:hypothetical protein